MHNSTAKRLHYAGKAPPKTFEDNSCENFYLGKITLVAFIYFCWLTSVGTKTFLAILYVLIFFHLLNSSKSVPLLQTDVRATVLFLCDVQSPSLLKSNRCSAESLISLQSQKRTLLALGLGLHDKDYKRI